jgi:hypothetical protein
LCGSVPRAEALSPKRCNNVKLRRKQIADEAVVVMKRKTDENMATYLRIKFSESTKDGKDEGWSVLT